MMIELYQLLEGYGDMSIKNGIVWSNISEDTLDSLIKKARGKLKN
jgi:hypothetical protein